MAYTTLQNAHGLRAMLLHSRMELPELYFFIIYVWKTNGSTIPAI